MNEQGRYGDGRSELDLAGKVKEVGGELKSKASQLAEQMTQTAKDQASEIGSTAKQFASDAATSAQSAIEEQKGLGAEYVASIADAVHRAAGEFDRELPFASKYLRQTADQIDNAARNVRERNLRELVGDVENFARQQPALFFGGAMLLGFAALRFLKSAPEGYSHDRSASAPAAPPKVHSPSLGEFDQDVRNNTYKGA